MARARATVTVAMIAVALAVGLTVLAPAPSPAARPRGIPVLMIGDSLTHHARPELRERRPHWVVDAVGGRKVRTLHRRIREDVSRYGVPSHLVIALGTNESPGWTRADYVAAVELVPRRTQVYLVTTYRDPLVFGWDRADTQARYSRWMRSIARDRANVWVVDWRRHVQLRPWLLHDGVHGTREGIRQWVDLVERRVVARR